MPPARWACCSSPEDTRRTRVNDRHPDVVTATYEPTRPTLAATGLLALWIAVLSFPMLGGRWLASPWSDQYAAGYAYRAWGAEWWHRLGHVPLWNPELFGGLPFVAAGHGDIFYPPSFLRPGGRGAVTTTDRKCPRGLRRRTAARRTVRGSRGARAQGGATTRRPRCETRSRPRTDRRPGQPATFPVA